MTSNTKLSLLSDTSDEESTNIPDEGNSSSVSNESIETIDSNELTETNDNNSTSSNTNQSTSTNISNNIDNTDNTIYTISNESQNDLYTTLIKSNISTALKEKIDKHSDLVNSAYDIFKSVYGNAMRPTVISSIIKGETIETKPENIFVDHDIKFDDPLFDKKCGFCSKTLYNYQKNAIKKLRELELRGYTINTVTHEHIISNGWLLSLPIGSGKSLVFQFLALFYRDIPCHPIILSTDGQHIPDHDQMQWKYYPYYYENCGYIPTQTNSIIVHKDYTQRKCTIILTHAHLLEQMEMYFNEDFPTIMQTAKNKKPRVKICYPIDITTINIDEYDIIVTPATPQNVDILVAASYVMPFLRVIIDDYTSMPGIETFRQILASSTIFVSGSGFNRSEYDIPPSYYTLKFMPVSKISLVGHPEETLEGIFRDSIATMELMGSNCEFSQYEFVTACDDIIKQRFDAAPSDVYPLLRKEPYIHHYMSLIFLVRYFDRIKKAIMYVEKDLRLIDQKTNKPKLDKERVSYYLEWKKMLADVEAHPPPVEKRTCKDGKIRNVRLLPSVNPLYLALFDDPKVGNQVGASMVQQSCMVCRKKITDHNGYGMVACCCGAFYCSNCLKSMCTHYIHDEKTGQELKDENHYYCGCCRAKDPRYYVNMNKKKDTNVYSYNLVNDYFDTSELKGHSTFDYYFYMFLKGFVPLYRDGKQLNVHTDIEQGGIDPNCFVDRVMPKLEKILPKDQLGILALSTINKTLHDLRILPKKNAIILFYGCPRYMVSRVMNYYNEIVKKNRKETALDIRRGGEIMSIQPISNLNIEFKEDVASLIGLHKNIVGIVQWQTPNKGDELSQLIGRILRLSSFGNKLYFYIATNNIGFA